MIKKIHYCWFGGEKPDSVKRNVDNWARLNPDFEILEWNESNIDVSAYEFGRRALENRRWAFLADIVRLVKLIEEGGVYMDTDVELISPLTCFENKSLGNKLQLGYMYNCALGTAVLYSPPQHRYLIEILHSYNYMQQNRWPVNNTIFTAYFINKVQDFLLTGQAWENDECRLFTKETFEQPSFIRTHGVAIHHCCGSWKKEFNRLFSVSASKNYLMHLLKWAARKRRTWYAERHNEFTECYLAAKKGVRLPFDISGIYTVDNPYTQS